jgi:hypothetical protein
VAARGLAWRHLPAIEQSYPFYCSTENIN